MKRRYDPRWRLRQIAGGIAGICLTLGLTGAATADPSNHSTSVTRSDATLYLLDSTFGDTQTPLYFQVVGQGFRPGEPVTLRASVQLPGQKQNQPLTLSPVYVLANDYGQVAATLDGDGYVGAGDGFIIRATGDQHTASIIYLVLAGASWTAPGGD